MRNLLCMLLIVACATFNARSQTTIIRGGKEFVFDTTKRSIILDLRGGLTAHFASDLRCLDDANCKPFQGGIGSTFGIGIGFEEEIDTAMSWIALAGFDRWATRQTVKDDRARVRDQFGNVLPLVRELALHSQGMMFELSGGVQYQLDAWRLWLMPSFVVTLGSPTWRQTATILSPTGITYPNGSTVDETVSETAIPDISAFRAGLRVGVGRDVVVEPVGIITPSLNLSYYPMSIRKGSSWTDLRTSLGVAVRFNVDDLPDTVLETRTLYRTDTVLVRRTGENDDDYVLRGRDRVEYDTTRDGYFKTVTETIYRTDSLVEEIRTSEMTTTVGGMGADGKGKTQIVWRRTSGKAKLQGPVKIDTLNVEKLDSTSPLRTLRFSAEFSQKESVFMVLPVVFFDAGSAEFPSRIRQIRSDDVLSYEERGNATSQEDINNDMLNIIGSRLASSDASITIHGHINNETDGGDCSIALARALTIKRYFVDIWSIDSSRINVEWNPTNCQPEVVSTSQSEKGQQESRRVDISSTAADLFLPVVRLDRTTKLVPSIDRLAVDELTITADATAEWNYTFELDGKVLWSRSGAGEFREVELIPETELYELTTDRKPVIVTLTVVNVRGDTLSTALQLPFKLDSKMQRIKRLSLATFAIRSATPSVRDEQLLNFFMTRLGKDDRVNVVGYTDDLGDPEGNVRLAQRRAEVVADLARRIRPDIKINTVVGVGSREYPKGIVNYDTPENRFLSRVVEVSIVE